MGDTNYFSGTVKLLDNPIQKLIKPKTLRTRVWVELAQFRQNRLILVTFWGNLAQEVKNYYQVNDYVLIEGYLSIEKKTSELFSENQKKMIITVLKIYPFLLKSNYDNIKV
jgi:single-stranded DNA-binding protein